MRVLSCAALLFILAPCLIAQAFPPATKADSDQDGLSDVLEDTLLAQVQPYFMIHRGDCSQRPAEFVRFEPRPSVRADDGTIYGQVFPHNAKFDEVELHYYHPWSKDCGETPHRLDAEHVSVLVKRIAVTSWRAVYWYAAAHEDTVCDASQIAARRPFEQKNAGRKSGCPPESTRLSSATLFAGADRDAVATVVEPWNRSTSQKSSTSASCRRL